MLHRPAVSRIEAVLRPAKTKDLYFVADGSGGHVFAASLDEHNKNVFKWRKVEREIRAKEEQEAAEMAAAQAAAGGGAGAAPPNVPADAAAMDLGGRPDQKGLPLNAAGDASITSGAFDDPSVLMDPAPNPFAVPPEAATGETVPMPARNPKR